MTITLFAKVYDTVRDTNGTPIVITQTGPSMWRVAKDPIAKWVLDGMTLSVVRP